MKKLILLLTIVLAVLIIVALMLPPASVPEDDGSPSTQPTETSITTEPQYTDATEQPTVSTQPTDPLLHKNPYLPSDFVYQGDFLTCVSAPCQLGIDVSKYQKDVDWQKVADSGITFVIIRIGGRGYGQTGNLYTDEMAQSHYQGAKAAGLKVGAYFFSQAISAEEAREEAKYALQLTADWQLDMPIVFDWEYVSDTARTANTDSQTVTDCAIVFCDTVLAAKKHPMIYVRPEQTKLLLEQLWGYDHWVAWYSDTMDYANEFIMWQYTKTGKVPGISGDVDINLYLIK